MARRGQGAVETVDVQPVGVTVEPGSATFDDFFHQEPAVVAFAPDASNRIVGAIDTGPLDLPNTVAYGAWAHVPPGTVYVTFTYGTEIGWQRPIRGFSSVLLGEASRVPSLDGTGMWRWQ
jgi:hypothetical protein